MTIPLKILGAPCAALLMACFAVEPAGARDPALLSLGMEHFRDTATVADDPLGAVATITTEQGYVDRQGPMGTVWNDEFLKSVIDKKSGQKSFNVSVWISYVGDWRSYQTARYQGTSGARSVPVTLAGKEQRYCAVGACTYTERLSFPIEENLLRGLAAESASGKRYVWPFKLIAKAGPNYAGGLSTAEIAGFLAKVDAYDGTAPALAAATGATAAASTGATPAFTGPTTGAGTGVTAAAAGRTAAASIGAAAASTANDSLKLDFGVRGLPVAAAAEQPNRAGVLIIAVAESSAAHASGVIVGDILYEFDGHPVKTPEQLEAAVAARPANSTATIKLYRGTTPMVVAAKF